MHATEETPLMHAITIISLMHAVTKNPEYINTCNYKYL
jgi:hypothetical protein